MQLLFRFSVVKFAKHYFGKVEIQVTQRLQRIGVLWGYSQPQENSLLGCTVK
jgi:hypothetical protein